MKIIFLLVLTLLMASFAGAQTRYSSDWLPISSAQTQTRVRDAANRRKTTELYSLWRQARTQKSYWSYAIALHDVVKEQPQNSTALATYCLILLETLSDYSKVDNFAEAKEHYFGDDLTWTGIRLRIEQAKKLDTEQWPLWVAQSQIIPYPGRPDMTFSEMGNQCETAARRALAIEYNSFTNSALAYALLSRSSWESKPELINRAIIAATRASQSQPVSVQAKAFLMYLYRVHSRPRQPAKVDQIKKQILATIPPGTKLSDSSKAYLKQLGIDSP